MSKKIVILGAGESGTGAAILARSAGYSTFVSDNGAIDEKYKKDLEKRNIPYEENTHSEDRILEADIVVKSPGIPDSVPLVKKLREKEVPVISEIEFASWYTKAKIIGITGSNGKTTTTLLTYHLLKKLGVDVGLAGNIGESLARQVAKNKHKVFVLELSSFQLDGIYKFKPDIAVLLNITPDHLDRYDNNFQNYVNSKFRIIRNMKRDDVFIFFGGDETILNEVDKRNVLPMQVVMSDREKVLNGAYLYEDKIVVSLNQDTFNIDPEKTPLRGKHNKINMMAALLAAKALGLDHDKFQEALSDFKNAPHRMELAGEVNGVSFINDSKATNIDSVQYALDSLDGNIIWIAGGVDKGNDYSQIFSLASEKVKSLVCLGKDNGLLLDAFDGKIPHIAESSDMHEAVTKAFEAAGPGDVVLLSPACASFDLFKNYEERGEVFKEAVTELEKSKV